MQALFSVVAIIAAASVSWVLMLSERSFRAKERAARTENLLVMVAGDFFPLFGAIQRLKIDIDRIHDRPPIVGDPRDHLRSLQIVISPRLNEAMAISIDMDVAIDPLRQTLMGATGYNAFIDALIKAWPFDPAEWPTATDQLEENRAMIEKHAQQLVDRYRANAK